MTRTAQAIHEELVLEEGFDPTSDDYYKEIDLRMRKEMPQKFKEKRSNAQTVAPASGNGRSVKVRAEEIGRIIAGSSCVCEENENTTRQVRAEVVKLIIDGVNKMADRTSREANTRESAQRPQQWRPGFCFRSTRTTNRF